MKKHNKTRIETLHDKDRTAEEIDPETLWLDETITPEELISLDPLEITSEMTETAEQPENGDFLMATLPPRRFSLRREAAERRLRQQALSETFTKSWLGSMGLA